MVFDEFLAIFQTMVTEVGRNYGRSLKMISIFINISLLSADFYEIRRKVCKVVTTTKNVDRIQQKFVLLKFVLCFSANNRYDFRDFEKRKFAEY